ncbi:hypothetical protein COLO4_21816 [Corchorus olitorius]|uniref:Very-long-chain aldehyde decarbonylase CER1-like C-terminal domain-containing protein n=1 Tax=Corchorus olitorius TaxID=93759 RepID=A0A1R3IQM8_9ROSI|nr:hypothetical protein COLO4_21816 [Corchorus olitorius]
MKTLASSLRRFHGGSPVSNLWLCFHRYGFVNQASIGIDFFPSPYLIVYRSSGIHHPRFGNRVKGIVMLISSSINNETLTTIFLLFIQFLLQNAFKRMKFRDIDCFYHTTPAMQAPMCLENVDSCENWLPRRVMSVWRIAGLVHALEGWEEHECGYTVSNIDKVWEATLKHGFQPLRPPLMKSQQRRKLENTCRMVLLATPMQMWW